MVPRALRLPVVIDHSLYLRPLRPGGLGHIEPEAERRGIAFKQNRTATATFRLHAKQDEEPVGRRRKAAALVVQA